MAAFVAFYSYKGGVGRTVSLVNVAWSLAKRGKRVLLMDMDLEAPDLHGFPGLRTTDELSPGVVEYASHYAALGECPPIEEYVRSVPFDSSEGGKLWVMPAGRLDEDYQRSMSHLRWRHLHREFGTGPFVATLKQAIEHTYRPQYVLIDSRTGFSDAGGLSTHQLASQVVLVFNLTKACLEGTARAYRSITDRKPTPKIALVASPLPPGTLVDKRLDIAKKLMPLGLSNEQAIVRVEYDASLALNENIAVSDPDRYLAAARYERLREMIQRANPADVSTVVDFANDLLDEGLTDDALTELDNHAAAYPDDYETHLELGRFHYRVGQYADAVESFRRAIQIWPDSAVAHRELGRALLRVDDPEGARAALEQANAYGDRSVELFRALTEAYDATNDIVKSTRARRDSVIATLGEKPDSVPPDEQDLSALRADFIAAMSREPPYASFDPPRFWDGVMGSSSLTRGVKLGTLRRVLAGDLPLAAFRRLERIVADEAATWRDRYGPDAEALQRRVAESGASSREELLALQRGDELDPLLVAHADFLASLLPKSEGSKPLGLEDMRSAGMQSELHASEAELNEP